MTANANKDLVEHIFTELGQGNSTPLVDAMADDCTWVNVGTNSWCRPFVGKKAVVGELFAAIRKSMEGRVRTVPHRFIAEGDLVVVEARGDNMTKDGKPYRNTYCMICRVEGGKLREVREYCDTELVTRALGGFPN
jgi:uncharacterized protein